MIGSEVVQSSARTGKGRDDWRTPKMLTDLVSALGPRGVIDLDPCAAPDPKHWSARVNICGPNWPGYGAFGERDSSSGAYGERGDGLESARWSTGYGLTFINPPYSKMRAWAECCARKALQADQQIVLLIAARTDTRAWHAAAPTAHAICLWRGRLRFEVDGGKGAGAPFPSALLYWGQHPQRFAHVFAPHGMVVRV